MNWKQVRTVSHWAWPRIVWIEANQWRSHWRVKLMFAWASLRGWWKDQWILVVIVTGVLFVELGVPFIIVHG